MSLLLVEFTRSFDTFLFVIAHDLTSLVPLSPFKTLNTELQFVFVLGCVRPSRVVNSPIMNVGSELHVRMSRKTCGYS